MDPESLEHTLEFLSAATGVEEVALFTSITHGPLPFDRLQSLLPPLARALHACRTHGLRGGINHLCTVGHFDELLQQRPPGQWQRMIGSDGSEAQGTLCVTDDRVAEYIAACYRELAALRPDFIWIDDDVRLEHHAPVAFACFCSGCLAIFALETGREWGRAQLVRALDGGTKNARELRRRWLQHNRDYVTRLVALCSSTISATSPRTEVGFMSTAMLYSGRGFTEIALAIAGTSSSPVKWRPGGGFYRDDNMPDLIRKIHDIGTQLGQLPSHVRDRQYELENFPNETYQKSARAMLAEIAAATTVGCTGVALNISGVSSDPTPEFGHLLAALNGASDFLAEVAADARRLPLVGAGLPFHSEEGASVMPDGGWFDAAAWENKTFPIDWSLAGIPAAYDSTTRAVVLINERLARAMAASELEDHLARAAVLDGPALRVVVERGYGSLTGFRCEGEFPEARETLSDDSLNGGAVGRVRDIRAALLGGQSFAISPTNPSARVLSTLTTHLGDPLGHGSGVFENSRGGRVVVLGYGPWTGAQSGTRISQLRSLMTWVSRTALPVEVSGSARSLLWLRHDEVQASALLMNATLDDQEVGFRVAADIDSVRCLLMSGVSVDVERDRIEDGWSCFRTPPLLAWQPALVRATLSGARARVA